MQLVIDQIGLGGNAIEYQAAWDLQRDLYQKVVAHQIPDTVLLLEHPSVYTAGRRTEAFERPVDGTPVVDVDRGGKITWHGPGQLVGYPILHLPSPMDVVSHVRRLEDVLIGICNDFGLETSRVKGRSGVWVLDPTEDRKIAAIGVRVAQGVTMHGFALNCNNDLSWFDRIVPCGLRDAGVTTMSKEIGRNISVDEVASSAEFHLNRVFGPIAESLSQDVAIDA
ncbi:MAG: lipoyl(octanoyl) transferase LipB [Candidatus Nanopelagicales bacterium]